MKSDTLVKQMIEFVDNQIDIIFNEFTLMGNLEPCYNIFISKPDGNVGVVFVDLDEGDDFKEVLKDCITAIEKEGSTVLVINFNNVAEKKNETNKKILCLHFKMDGVSNTISYLYDIEMSNLGVSESGMLNWSVEFSNEQILTGLQTFL